MFPILAEAAPSADSFITFAKVAEVAAWISVTLAAIIVSWKQISGKSDEVKIGDTVKTKEDPTYATKPELNAVESRLNGEVHQLHGRISSVRNELTTKYENLDDRIDAIPQRTIELLKTVKEYHGKP